MKTLYSISRWSLAESVGLLITTVLATAWWARSWLLPDWLPTTALTPMLILWAVCFGAALVALCRSGPQACLWLAFTAQWVGLFRPESWALAGAAGVFTAWLLSGSARWKLGMSLVCTTTIVALASYERTYGTLIADSVAAILQTTATEAFGFVAQHVTPSLAGMLVLMVLTHRAIHRLPRESVWPPFSAVFASALILVMALLGVSGQGDRAKAVHAALKSLKLQQDRIITPDAASVMVGSAQPLDVIFIIGESNTRWHWQLYGYPGQTTPRLHAMKDQLMVFSDAVSSHSHTVPVILDLMYRPYLPATGDQTTPLVPLISLVDTLNVASVQTHWYSAQAPHGLWASPVARLAGKSQLSRFFQHGGDGRMGSHLLFPSADRQASQAVLAAIETSAAPRRLIVQHMQAAHADYCQHELAGDRYELPVLGTAFFGRAADLSESVRCYDRAVRFVDDRVATVMSAAAAASKPTVVIFMPDHGEAPEEGTGHNSASHSARHVEIPLLIHMNRAAIAAWPEKHAHLQRNVNQPFLGSWTHELILDLFDIKVRGLKPEASSLAGADFAPSPRVLFRDSQPIFYDQMTVGDRKDYLGLTRLNLDAIKASDSWNKPLFAHRVDSVAKALEAKQYFSGLEMDLTFDAAKGAYEVFHPPARNHHLPLDFQLQAISDRPELKLWFDVKNPSASTLAAELQALDVLDRRWSLKARTVVELAEGGELMKAFSSEGWKTSFYLPAEFLACASKQADEVRCRAVGLELVAKARAGGATFLSFDLSLYPAIQRFISPHKGSLGLLSWSYVDSTTPGLARKLKEMPQLEGLIIPMRSKFDY